MDHYWTKASPKPPGFAIPALTSLAVSQQYAPLAAKFFMVTCLLALFAGCGNSGAPRSLPAPLRDVDQIQLKGQVFRWWGADNFEFGDQRQLHYIILQGITAPAPGEPYFIESRSATIRLTKNREITIDVVDRDPFMREIAVVTIPREAEEANQAQASLDLGLELLNQGWARFDGSAIAQAEEYREAEARARNARLGIWAESRPAPKPN